LIDKDKLLLALRGSIQSPRAGELLIHRIEQGEFDVAEETGKKAKAAKAPSD
jgi:hypothetical protein